MENILLYVGRQSQLSDIILWVVLVVGVIVSVVLIFIQKRNFKQLTHELEQLDQVKKHNIEYEFILKAMRLSTWHVDVSQRQMTFDNDFRENGGNYVPAPGTPLDDVLSVVAEKDRDMARTSFENLFSGKQEFTHNQYQIALPYSRSPYWSESYATIAERDSEGNPVRIVGASMRIDDRKRIEEELIKARNRAEESDRLKSAFVANISHEIRTPLNAIVGFTSILPDIADETERKSLLDLIQENTSKLLRIIDDVVSISRIEAGEEELVMTSFELTSLLSEQIEAYRKECHEGVELVSEFAESNLMVTTDLNRLVEIIKHLLSNATKFTDEGTITLGFDAPVDGRVRLWVRDTGKGIAEENQQRVFERFYKVDEFVPGAGLGLSLCRTLAYSLGGEIGLESRLGRGSLFWVDIPIR